MIERRREELRLVEAQYGELELGPNCDWFIVRRFSLVAGWNKSQTRVLVQIPPGYPAIPPDNFYTDPDLLILGGTGPGSTSAANVLGQQWLMFSFHFVEAADWQPHSEAMKGHNFLTFLHGVASRLLEVS